ncbi:CDP-alcohol phosphatidyltransferase [Cellulomonas denverensis]|uniref:Phosphatidylinositol phosphate synthase n=2 Tax=Cellulomonas denverensis TaxID=264297 RepID=A0A7X6KT55_9CELL|nr:CDP-alcohol phosphatidyltransferase family protein [Cellulomonas denverensis]GIG24285.1 CDP-alcohol phosphatidyltransferase [Cellulomonas denverensis]
MDRLRGFATRIFTPVADRLLRWGVSPDAVTITGTVIVVLAALILLPTGHLLAGGLVITAFVLTDSLDGVMARRAGRSGNWGAFLDSTLDRFADAAIFTGLVLWFAGQDGAIADWGLALALACLVLGSIVPYARARAEGLGMTAKVGIAERADRLVAVLVATLAVGAGLPPVVLVVVLGLLAVASFITVVQRMATVRRQAVSE